MRKVFNCLMIMAVIAMVSCHKNPVNQGSLKLKFNPMFAGQNMTLDNIYGPINGVYYNFTNLKFYLAHIKLVRSDASTVEVNPLVFFSLSDSADMSISLADSLGSFVGIQFYVGLDSTQDNVSPNPSMDTSNPQSPNNNMYWDATRKYVFIITEGYADQNTTPQNPIEYHVGMSPYYTPVQLTYSFSVTAGKQTTLVLNSNFEQIFNGTPTSINVLLDPYTEVGSGSDANNVPYTTLGHTFMTDFSQTFTLTTQ